jgi:hypothetical protein
MSDTPRLGLPELSQAQAQKEVTHNEALRILDALVQAVTIDYAAEPTNSEPTDGDLYLIANGATGDWTGHDGGIAYYKSSAWVFITPSVGWLVYNLGDSKSYRYSGNSETPWDAIAGGGGAGTYASLSDVDGNYADYAGGIPRVNATETGLDTFELPADVCVFWSGSPTSNQVILRKTFARNTHFWSGWGGSQVSSGVAATASTVFSIKKNGSEVGTITFGAGNDWGTAATTGNAEVTFDAGDVMTIVSPASPDGTLADIEFTLMGNDIDTDWSL